MPSSRVPVRRSGTTRGAGAAGTGSASRTARRRSSARASPDARPFVPHRLVPPHEILSAEESAKVLAELRVSADRLPKILLTDAGLRTDRRFSEYLERGEPLVGRLVRITRPSPTAGSAVAYRVIVGAVGSER